MTNFDLGEPAADADEEPANEQDEEDSEPEDASTSEPESPTDRNESSSSPESDHERDPTETGPAFPYSEVKQSPLYACEETWTEFEDELDFTVTPELRRMGIRDDELREIYDVALEIVIDNIEEIPERLAEKRREPWCPPTDFLY